MDYDEWLPRLISPEHTLFLSSVLDWIWIFSFKCGALLENGGPTTWTQIAKRSNIVDGGWFGSFYGLVRFTVFKLKCQRTRSYLYVSRKTCITFRKYDIFLSVWELTCSVFFFTFNSFLPRQVLRCMSGEKESESTFTISGNETVHSVGVKAKNEPPITTAKATAT